MPIASTILMIRPISFGFNEETAANNYFQQKPGSNLNIQQAAIEEFDKMVEILRTNQIDVLVFDDISEPAKPDAVFPNNWISTSPNGIISLFPMYAPSRRTERRNDIVKWLKENFRVNDVQDWSGSELENNFLEGTGSMIIDHDNKMIYASISERTSVEVLEKFAATNDYQAIVFVAADKNGQPVYHTNVVMSLGDEFALLCEEAIDEEWELIAVRQLLESTNHIIIPITKEQMHCFAANVLQVKNKKEEKILLLSQTAFDSLRKEQKQMLEAYSKLLPLSIPTIEKIEGGSVRCMIAEIFLERKTQA